MAHWPAQAQVDLSGCPGGPEDDNHREKAGETVVQQVYANKQTHWNFKKSENLSGFLQIGNTQRRTHKTYPKPRKELDKFIFKKKPR